MRILVLHNRYLHPGGEDTAYDSEVALLRAHGHEVLEYVDDNERIGRTNPLSVALQTTWSWRSHRAIEVEIRRFRPEIVHSHNFFPLISPAAYYACRSAGVPVVQSLYNPRLICPSATLYRQGRLCTDCVGTTPLHGVMHACYRHSRLQTLAVASMLSVHGMLGTWSNLVSKYLVATEFYRDLFSKGGLPPSRIVIKPNFIASDPGYDPSGENGNYALFIGRLGPEKGIRPMLTAWQRLSIPLIVRGSGALEEEVRERIEKDGLSHVKLVGRVSRTELVRLIKDARFLVWPSEGYYETFGFAAVESFAAGVPVVASRIGVMQEIVLDGETGLHFRVGDPEDLASKAEWLWERPEELRRLGANARREYEDKYTPDRNYELLMDIYRAAIAGDPP